MTSKLTRDQLRERAQLKAKNLTYAISQSAFAGVRSELEEELQFLQCALACLEGVNSEPAPVLPEKCPAEIRDLLASHSDALFNDDDAQEIWNACRAAMHQVGNSPAQSDCCQAQNHVSPEQNGDTPAQSQGWIQVSERMPEAEGHYLVWTNASRIDGYCDHLAIATYQGGGWSNEFNWLVTHWMPLPAGPQEVNYG
ncbi:DUF551 domain-containing protein [Klebsiella pneumoniae]|nr:DUF551 domain-containing protein [Klebsiella pneumoniae]